MGLYYRDLGTTILKPEIDKKLYKNQLDLYNKFYPKKIVQLKAIAKSAGFIEEYFIYNNICSDIVWHKAMNEPQKGCTIFGLENAAGVFVGRNYDWKPGTEKHFKVFNSKNSDAFDYIGITDMDYFKKSDATKHHLFYDIDDAINEKGLYIGLTFAYHDGIQNGLSPIHMNQLIAETCATVDEALAVFNKIPLAVPKNFFIADAKGDMAVVEHAGSKYKILKPVNGILIQTNHYNDPELAKEDTVLKRNELSTTYKRYAEALEILTINKERIHQIGLERILKDPDSNILENNNKIKTIWSLSLDMKARNYRLYWNFFDGLKEDKLEI